MNVRDLVETAHGLTELSPRRPSSRCVGAPGCLLGLFVPTLTTPLELLGEVASP